MAWRGFVRAAIMLHVYFTITLVVGDKMLKKIDSCVAD